MIEVNILHMDARHHAIGGPKAVTEGVETTGLANLSTRRENIIRMSVTPANEDLDLYLGNPAPLDQLGDVFPR